MLKTNGIFTVKIASNNIPKEWVIRTYTEDSIFCVDGSENMNLSEKQEMAMSTLSFDATERMAAEALGVHPQTIRKWRLAGKIPSFCYTKYGYKCVRFCLPLLRDWQLAPEDLDAQARAIKLLQSQRPSNQPRKRGRKVAA